MINLALLDKTLQTKLKGKRLKQNIAAVVTSVEDFTNLLIAVVLNLLDFASTQREKYLLIIRVIVVSLNGF